MAERGARERGVKTPLVSSEVQRSAVEREDQRRAPWPVRSARENGASLMVCSSLIIDAKLGFPAGPKASPRAGGGAARGATEPGPRSGSGRGVASKYESCYMSDMATKRSETRITTMQLRAHLGEVLDRVRLRSTSVLIERRGRPVAALVPAGRMIRIEEFARTKARELLAVVDAAALDADGTERAIETAARAVKAVRRGRVKR